MLRVVKSTPAALVKLRGAQLNQARWAWLNHFAAQSGGWMYHAKHAIIEPTNVGGIKPPVQARQRRNWG